MNFQSDISEMFQNQPFPLWWDPFCFFLDLVCNGIAGWKRKISVFIRKAMKEYGMYIGGAVGGLVTALIGKVIIALCSVNLDPSSMEYHTAQDLLMFSIIVGTGIGGYIGEIISSKLSPTERR